MVDAWWAGMVAGYGIAIPVGPIAVLLVTMAATRGFRPAAAAAAGTASADLTYAILAALFGAALAAFLAPVLLPVRLVGAAVLGFIGLRGLARALSPDVSSPTGPGTPSASPRRTYLAFLALTLANPMTFLYFAALVVGLPTLEAGAGSRLVFAVGAFLASLSWQLLLVGLGSRLHHRLSPQVERGTRIGGSLIVLAFAAWVGYQAFTG